LPATRYRSSPAANAESGDGFHYRLVVEYEPRRGPRGVYDRLLVRRAIGGAMRQTIANLERALGDHPVP
jgi:hypothetical protein